MLTGAGEFNPITGENVPGGVEAVLARFMRGELNAGRGVAVLTPEELQWMVDVGYLEELGEDRFELTFEGRDVLASAGTFLGSGGGGGGGGYYTQAPGGRYPGASSISLGLTNWRI
jgi:hypothetical protein